MSWSTRHAVLALFVSAATAVPISCGSAPDTTVKSAPPGVSTEAEGTPAEQLPGLGERRSIGDSDGNVVGTFSQTEYRERSHRVTQRLLEENWLPGREGQIAEDDRKVLIDSLLVLDPLPVVDEAGSTIGYFTTEFVPIDAYPSKKKEAERVIEALRASN